MKQVAVSVETRVAAAEDREGATGAFGVHGYSNPVIEEACRLGLRTWHFRHEQAAGFAADAYARTARELDSWFEPPDWPRGIKHVQVQETHEEIEGDAS